MTKKEENIIEITSVVSEWLIKYQNRTDKTLSTVKDDIIRWAEGFEVLNLDPDRYEFDYITDIRFFTLGKIAEEWNGWWLADSDCAQYGKKHEKFCDTYSFIQLQWLDTTTSEKMELGLGTQDGYVVVYDNEIKIFDTDEEIEGLIAPYGYTIDGLRESYGQEAMFDIIAECQFESYSINDSNAVTGIVTKEKALEKLYEIITYPQQ